MESAWNLVGIHLEFGQNLLGFCLNYTLPPHSWWIPSPFLLFWLIPRSPGIVLICPDPFPHQEWAGVIHTFLSWVWKYCLLSDWTLSLWNIVMLYTILTGFLSWVWKWPWYSHVTYHIWNIVMLYIILTGLLSWVWKWHLYSHVTYHKIWHHNQDITSVFLSSSHSGWPSKIMMWNMASSR